MKDDTGDRDWEPSQETGAGALGTSRKEVGTFH